ncbi:sigma-70 family RNA polymerase sigma factor [Telluria aromaticivorans]|uniref:RNA polymerase sigma factor n=1 Tax=Telluria aromaticivorans TaxID=2725995 RepID=A0A7Y2NXL0_9BURK|nr:sigma-70 family RNA polymerase sigma factor [Telluria aromaticivorans]NNG21837.1 sigma-70 family RNA polymerase sigma factor [Telluria aromaticivorans]
MKSRQEIDLELVKSAQAGDMAAFESLMTRYRTRLIRYLSPMVRDTRDTEDVVQDTFIKVFMALHSFRGESSFSTWLFRIGINTAKRSLTRRGRRIPQLSEPAVEGAGSQQHSEADTDYETPEAAMESKQILDIFNTALSELPAGQRAAFILREIEGFSYEEIAEQMNSPVGTVRSRIHRARDAIAAALKDK